jgi:hypothetical protein
MSLNRNQPAAHVRSSPGHRLGSVTLVVLQSFEDGLERMVDGVFSRAFRSHLRPIELGRRMVREMDAQRTVDVSGRVVVPNQFLFTLSPADRDQFASIEEALVRELADAARTYAKDENYSFLGPVQVKLTDRAELRSGRFELAARMKETGGGRGAGSVILPSGDRLALGNQTVTMGRLPECEITLADPNSSRRHAEIRPRGNGWVVADLGSTNGTKVNGATITEHQLRDGDVIMIGTTRVRFENS